MLSSNAQTSPGRQHKTQPTGQITKADVYDIGQLVRSVKADIKHIKEQLLTLPAFPQAPNKTNVELNVPIKKILAEQKYSFLTSDPENKVGQEMLRSKFSLPPPNQFKYGRHQGGISNIELEKLGVGARQIDKTTKPKRILPKNFRDDPFADPPPITENDIQDGMYSLLNRGVIPKDVDLTPAFERGGAPLEIQRKRLEQPTQGKQTTLSMPTQHRFKLAPAQQQVDPSNTFLTAVGGDVEAQLKRVQRSQGANYHPNTQHPTYANQPLMDEPLPNNTEATDYNRPEDQYAVVPAYQQPDPDGQYLETFLSDPYYSNQEKLKPINVQQIVIKQGRIDEQSAEYVQFKRQNITKWGGLTYLLQQIERLISQYPVSLCQLDVNYMISLADLEQDRYTREDLLRCVVNQQQVIDVMTSAKTMFKGANGPILAAIKIQTCWRRHKAFSAFDQLKFLMKMATIIQRKYRLYQLKKSTQVKVARLRQESLKVWREMQSEFKNCWPQIKTQRRVEIHINSYSISESKRLSLDKYKQRENSQITRMFSLKDPNVDIIYISPYTLTSEVSKYYLKILELVEIEEPLKRFHNVVPENYVYFHQHLSLAQALLYSPKACSQILNLIADRQAYIVPGKAGDDDIKLSIQLGIPILSGEPEKSSVFATKSGAKRIFQQCDIPIPVSAYDIYDKKEFEQALARLIANNLDVNVWLFKVDDEFGARGHASLDVEQVRTIVELRKKKVEMTDAVIMRLQEVLNKVLSKKIKLAQPTLWKNWDHYMEEFCRSGGVIEAAPPMCQINQLQSPSVSFLIEPDGFVKLIGSFDKFSSAEFVNAGCFFPQTSLPSLDLLKICKSVGSALYDKNVIGHITIDLVSFPNAEDPKSHPFFWAIDINQELTDNAAVCFFFDMLMEGKLDQQTGEYNVSWEHGPEDPNFIESASEQASDSESKQKENKQLAKSVMHTEPRGFMFCNFLHHPGLARIQYKTFFQMCRQEQISFDMENRTGSTFCLYDCLQSATIGMLTIGVHRKAAVNYMQAALSFIQNQAGTLPTKTLGEFQGKDQLSIADVYQRIKIIARAFEKAARVTGSASNEDQVKPNTSFIQTIT